MEATFIDTVVSGLPGLLAVAGISGVVIYLSYLWKLRYDFLSWNENGRLVLQRKNLPPGSMGLPWFGETLAWRKNQDEFYDSHLRRYGEIYKTHLFGFPTVFVTTPEGAKKLLISNGDSLKGHSPGEMVTLLGPHFVDFTQGDEHTLLRKRLMKHLQPEALKALIPTVEELALKQVSGWSNGSTITFVDEIARYTLGVGMLAFMGSLVPVSAAKLNQDFNELEKGFAALPINKPGYQYYDSLQARSRFLKAIHDIINTRQTEQNSKRPKDILSSFMDDEDPLPQNVIDDNVIGFLFAADRTTAGVISFALKHLHDHPHFLQEVKDEQEKVRSKNTSNDPLSWEDLKDMPYTYQVMQESLRLSNVVAFQYNLVEKDLAYKGYVIPKDWRLITLQRQWHLDPKLYPDPYKFDPSRFQTPKQAFHPFGMGTHFCAGYELARVECLIFLHHFVTKFRYKHRLYLLLVGIFGMMVSVVMMSILAVVWASLQFSSYTIKSPLSVK